MIGIDAYVIHSAYPDGSWRGIEKCLGNNIGALLLFADVYDAKLYLESRLTDMRPYFKVVKVTLQIPNVREPIVEI